MQCTNCGNTNLLPRFKWCPECGAPLPRAQKIQDSVEHGGHGIERTLLQQSAALTSHNGDLGLNNRSTQGKFNINVLIGLLFMAVKNHNFSLIK